MGIVKKDGKWRLEKKKDGVYLVTEREEVQAKIITDEYVAEGLSDERADMMTEVIEVRDFSAAKREFRDYIDRAESSGGLF